MRVIIAGSRDISNIMHHVHNAVFKSGFIPSVVISGTARGVDQGGEIWATEQKIPIEQYPADWQTHGKSAGYKRNQLMAKKADALVAIWDGKSRGTKHMIDIMNSAGKSVYVEYV